MLHHVHAEGSASVLLDAGHPLIATAESAPGGEVAAVLELADLAPVDLRERTRALLWITGRLRLLKPATARARALLIAETRPDSALLDLGHSARMLCLHASSLVLSDGEGTHSLHPSDFAAATPDPFCRHESEWLRHLEVDHADVLHRLGRHLPPELRGGRIRPLGLDRFGLRLRTESEQGDHDVRLAFARPAQTQQEFAAELRRLVGCPFLAGGRRTRH